MKKKGKTETANKIARDIIVKTDIANLAADHRPGGVEHLNNLYVNFCDNFKIAEGDRLMDALTPGWRERHRKNEELYKKLFKAVGLLARDYCDSWTPEMSAEHGSWFSLGFASAVRTFYICGIAGAKKKTRKLSVNRLAHWVVGNCGIKFNPVAAVEGSFIDDRLFPILAKYLLVYPAHLDHLKDLISSDWRESKKKRAKLYKTILKKIPLVRDYVVDFERMGNNRAYYLLGFEAAKELLGM